MHIRFASGLSSSDSVCHKMATQSCRILNRSTLKSQKLIGIAFFDIFCMARYAAALKYFSGMSHTIRIVRSKFSKIAELF